MYVRKEKFKLRILSPTHIGDGNYYMKWDYGIKDEWLYIFDIEKVFENLTPRLAGELMAELQSGQTNSYENLGEFLQTRARYLKWEELCKYKVPCSTGKIRKIYTFMKEATKPYIPGSTLKGFIRTAIIYCLMKERGYKFDIDEKEFEDKKRDKRFKVKYIVMIKPDGTKIEGIDGKRPDIDKIYREIFKDLCGADSTNDIFKYLYVSDSCSESVNNLKIYMVYVANTTSFVKKGGKVKMHPEHYECVIPKAEFSDISIQVLRAKDRKLLRNYEDTYNKIKVWERCVKEFVDDLITAELEFWKNEQVKNNIRKVYSKSYQQEIVNNFNKVDVIRNIEHIRSLLKEGNLILRLGKLSGYFTHSIGLLMTKDKSYDIGDFGELVFPNFHIGEVSPLTRRLTTDNQILGWCKLEGI